MESSCKASPEIYKNVFYECRVLSEFWLRIISADNYPTRRKSIENILCYKVGRVLSFSPVVGIGAPPTPHPQASVPPPPPVLGGGAHSLAREGGWESPISGEGTYTVALWYSINIYVLNDFTAHIWAASSAGQSWVRMNFISSMGMQPAISQNKVNNKQNC